MCRKTDPRTEITSAMIGLGKRESRTSGTPHPDVGPTAQPDRRIGDRLYSVGKSSRDNLPRSRRCTKRLPESHPMLPFLPTLDDTLRKYWYVVLPSDGIKMDEGEYEKGKNRVSHIPCDKHRMAVKFSTVVLPKPIHSSSCDSMRIVLLATSWSKRDSSRKSKGHRLERVPT